MKWDDYEDDDQPLQFDSRAAWIVTIVVYLILLVITVAAVNAADVRWPW